MNKPNQDSGEAHEGPAPVLDEVKNAPWLRQASSPVELKWSCEWQEAASPTAEEVDDLTSHLIKYITSHANERREKVVIRVRGILGVGKTKFADVLIARLTKEAKGKESQEVKIALARCRVLDAPDTLTPEAFANERVLRALQDERARLFVILGRPDYLDETFLHLDFPPDVDVTIRRFEPGEIRGRACIQAVCAEVGLDSQLFEEVMNVVNSRLTEPVYHTPFWFKQIAILVKSGDKAQYSESTSPLLMFEHAARRALNDYDSRVEMIAAQHQSDNAAPHFGYVSVVLALLVLRGRCEFTNVAKRMNAFEAVELLIKHLKFQRRWAKSGEAERNVLEEFERFLQEPDPDIPHVIYVQGIVAACLKELGKPEASRNLGVQLLQKINGRSIDDKEDYSSWWDVSDALSAIGDPRLERSTDLHYAMGSSGYFTELDFEIDIGSDHIPRRMDASKPVLPYQRSRAMIGPMWIANFPVTVEEFRSFFSDPRRNEFYRYTGGQWQRKDKILLSRIEEDFDRTHYRCLAPEIAEQSQRLIPGQTEKQTKRRALRETTVPLWQRDDTRFKRRGNPVVDVTWWDAMAYCQWWTETKLRDAKFPDGCYASLPTDWEWEAIRRKFYEIPELADASEYVKPRYPAHLRPASVVHASRRVQNVLHPLHVGLSPVPCGDGSGPYDMVGNVWEWTRSRVFAEIRRVDLPVSAPAATSPGTSWRNVLRRLFGDRLGPGHHEIEPEGRVTTLSFPYGGTMWDQLDESRERQFDVAGRDTVDELNDLGMRAERGSSFFMDDPQAAWNPAYRMGDPPYYSFLDVGFRIAVYPPRSS